MTKVASIRPHIHIADTAGSYGFWSMKQTGGPAVTYTDITDHLRSWSCGGGRESEFDTYRASTLEVVLDGRNGRFSGTGDHHDIHVGTMIYLQLLITDDAGSPATTTINLFTGSVDSIRTRYTTADNDTEVVVTAIDAMGPLSVVPLYQHLSVGAGTAHAQIDELLDLADWEPSTEGRDLDIGNSTLQAWTAEDVTAIGTHLDRICAAEGGCWYVECHTAGYPTVVFRERFDAVSTWGARETFGDSANQIPYHSIDTLFDPAAIVTRIYGTRVGGAAQTANSKLTETEYGVGRTLTWTDLLNATDAEVLDMISWVAAKRGVPRRRVESLRTAIWRGCDYTNHAAKLFYFGGALRTPAAIHRNQQGSDTEQVWGGVLENWRWSQAEPSAPVDIVLGFSPMEDEYVWILGDADLSLLGTSTVLGW
jgi:hypothetical protein